MGHLILIGAGPGDPELITLKGINALKRADVVLYDALANDQLLDYCKADCEKIYVGKKSGLHIKQQAHINELIVEHASKDKVVVRLKGGDPFVFGRGHEEMEHARQHNIESEVIPGVTSSISVPSSHHIPLTKRGINESFWVVTGTTRSHKFSKDLVQAASIQRYSHHFNGYEESFINCGCVYRIQDQRRACCYHHEWNSTQ